MSVEQQFYQQLQDVPELPKDLFNKIEKKLKKQKLTKVLLSVAAGVVLFAGPMSIAIHHNTNNNLKQEVVAELEDIMYYVNGDDLDQDIEMYAIIENY